MQGRGEFGDGRPLLFSVRMGYGHLRAAVALGATLGLPVVELEDSSLTPAAERRLWRRTRRLYEGVSRASQLPAAGLPLMWLLDRTTAIHGPPGPAGSQAAPTGATRGLRRLVHRGLGAGLRQHLEATGRALVTTFYAPALAVDGPAGPPVLCVVTDSDIHRVWAPHDPASSRVTYLAPTRTAAARLRAYGVAEERVRCTGFPLPPELVGGPGLEVLREDCARRLERLAPDGAPRGPLHVVFAVGGAGARARRGAALVSELEGPLRQGQLRLTLVAGARPEVECRFRRLAARTGLGGEEGSPVAVLGAPTFAAYEVRFNRLLRSADVLWTKPSELVFFAALGLPLVLDDPVGDHERRNREWLVGLGAALPRPRRGETATALTSWRRSGELAGVACAGLEALPADGVHRIADLVRALG